MMNHYTTSTLSNLFASTNKNFQTKNATSSKAKKPEWMIGVLMLMFTMLFTGFNAGAQVTVTGNANTAPAMAATYTSLALAVADVNNRTAISGPVTITLAAAQTAPAGGYSLTNTAITGGSDTNRFIFVGGGNTITAAVGTTTTTDAFFKIIGADFITLQNFTLAESGANTTTTTQMEWGIALLYANTTNGAQGITLQGNSITLNRTNANTVGIYSNSTHSATAVGTSATATGATGGNHNLKVYSNTITNVNQGIIVVGPTPAADVNTGIEIGGTSLGNTITNYGTTSTSSFVNVSGTVNGILIRNSNGFVISNNTVTSSVGGTTSATLNGIQVQASSITPTTTFTNNINSNNISLQSGSITGTMVGITYPSGSASATSVLNVNSNNFATFGHTVAGTGAITFITVTSTNLTTSISSNTFTNISVNTTGSVTFIAQSFTAPATGSKTTNSNSIVGTFAKTGAGGTVTFITDNGSTVSGAVSNCQNNNFSNGTLTGATLITGISYTDGGTAPTRTVTGNTINNWTTGAATINAMNFTYWNGVSSLSNNTVTNITGQGAITGITIGATVNTATSVTIANNTITNLNSTGAGGSVVGITCSNTSTLININNNSVRTLASTGVSAVTGISITGATNTNVFKNTISDLAGTNASSTVNGIAVGGGTTITLSNNRIGDLRTPAANAANPLNGINVTGSTTVNAYYNTVYLNATSSGALFGSSAISVSAITNVELRNNVFVNTSTSNGAAFATAYRRSSTTLTTYTSASERNDFFGSTIFTDGTNTFPTLAGYKGFVTPRDANSVSENPPFLSTTSGNANFLKINTAISTALESGGTPISGFADDFEGDARNASTPDIGADEFAGTPLAGCSGTPGDSTISGVAGVCTGAGTTLSLSPVYTDIGITYAWFSGTTPGGPYPTALGTSSTQATGNLTTTTYYQAVITCSNSGLSFTTPEKSVVVNALPTVTLTPSTGSICSPGGSPVALTAGGAVSYTYTNNASLTPSSGANVSANPSVTTTYVVTGTDANGCVNTASSTITVSATPTGVTATATPATICSGGTSTLTATAAATLPTLVNAYTFDGTGTGAALDPMTGATVLVSASTDDAPMNTSLGANTTAGAAVALPFTFNFNGTNYNQYSVSPDGWLLFGSATSTSQFTNAVTSTTNIPKIYPYWDDLATGTTGNVSAVVTGSSPNRILKVQWFVTVPRNTTGAPNSTFQAWLYEGSNKVEFRYGTMGTPTGTSNISAGMTGGSTNFQSITYSTNTASTSTANDTNNIAPASGTLYSFVPTSLTLSYAWSPAGDVVSPTAASTATNPLTATQTFSVTVSNGACAAAPVSTTVTVSSSAPTVAVTPAGPITLCGAATQVLTATPTGSTPFIYEWTVPVGVTNPGNAATVTATLAGNYSVIVTDACSVQSSASNTVAVSVFATPTATPSSNSPLCAGNDLNLSSGTTVANTTYSWTGPNTFTSTAQHPSIPAVTIAGTGTYSLTVTTDGCPSAAVTTAVVVNPAVTAPSASASSATICSGATVDLTSSATNQMPAEGYTMDSNSGVSFIDISTTGTSVGTITDDSEHNLTIPSFTYNLVAYTTARVGNNGVLAFGATAGEINYSNRSLPAPLGVNNTDQLTGGLMTSTGTLTAICANWDDMTPGTGASIRTQTVGTKYIVQWTNEDNFGATGTGTITFQIQLELTTGKINLVYSDINYGVPAFDGGGSATVGLNYSASSGLQYTFNTGTAALVDGQSITFTPNQAALTYAWTSDPAGFTSTDQNPTGVAPLEDTTYKVVASNTAGCSSPEASTTVTVLPNYTITASSGPNGSVAPDGATSVCSGGSQAYTISPDAGYLIQDVLVGGESQGAITSYTFTDVTSNHTISATFVTACTPVALESASATTATVCADGGTTLVYTGLTGTGASVIWSTFADGTGDTYGTGTPSEEVGPGTYYAYATGECGTPVSILVTVLDGTPSAPTGALTIVNSTCVACELTGGSIAVGSVSGSGGTLEYSTNGGSSWSSSLPTYAAPQTILASVLSSGGCRSASFQVGTTEAGTCTPVTAGITNNSGTTELSCGQTSINVTATGGGSYSWNGGATPGTAANSFTTSGTYTVTVTNADGCSDTEQIVVTGTVSAPSTWYLDADGDRYITSSATTAGVSACTQPSSTAPAVYRVEGGAQGVLGFGVSYDCNDAVAAINPGVADTNFNSIDDNCDGSIFDGHAPVVVDITTPSGALATMNATINASTATNTSPYSGAPQVTYIFKVTKTNAPTSVAYVTSNTTSFTFSSASNAAHSSTYDVQATAIVNGEEQPYNGDTESYTTPAVPTLPNPPTQTGPAVGPCTYTLAAINSYIYANNSTTYGASRYEFLVERMNGATVVQTVSVATTVPYFRLTNIVGIPATMEVTYGTTYRIRVRYGYGATSFGSETYTAYGTPCLVSTPALPISGIACDTTLASLNAYIYTSGHAGGANQFEFKVTRVSPQQPGELPITVTEETAIRNVANFKLTMLTSLFVGLQKEYSVSVRYRINSYGVQQFSAWSTPCPLYTPDFPATGIVEAQCGVEGVPSTLSQYLYADAVPGATLYRFRLFNNTDAPYTVGSPYDHSVYSPDKYVRLIQFPSLIEGVTYTITVVAQQYGEYLDIEAAKDCAVTAPASTPAGPAKIVAASVFQATAYPNPFANNFKINVKSSSESLVNLKVYDMIGRLIEQRDVPVSAMETTSIGDRYPSGVYNVVVAQEDNVQTVRVVKR